MSNKSLIKAGKNVFNDVVKSNETGEIVNIFSASKDPMKVVSELVIFTHKYCERIQERNLKVYKDRVRPRLIKCDRIEMKLKKENLTKEEEKEFYGELAEICKEIDDVGKDYYKSITDKLAIGSALFSLGTMTGAIIMSIYSGVRK